jgi:hypothetical protein
MDDEDGSKYDMRLRVLYAMIDVLFVRSVRHYLITAEDVSAKKSLPVRLHVSFFFFFFFFFEVNTLSLL